MRSFICALLKHIPDQWVLCAQLLTKYKMAVTLSKLRQPQAAQLKGNGGSVQLLF